MQTVAAAPAPVHADDDYLAVMDRFIAAAGPWGPTAADDRWLVEDNARREHVAAMEAHYAAVAGRDFDAEADAEPLSDRSGRGIPGC